MQKISVCIATFNGGKYILKQLESVLNQIEHTDEVIISDDNSHDDTLTKVNSLNDQRVKIIINKTSLGPVKNFERAISIASGDFIFLCDQDDVWEVNKVTSVKYFLESHDLVLTDCKVVDKYDNVLHKSFFKYRGSKVGFWNNLYKNSYVGCCMAFRRGALSYILPFPDSIHMHDWWIGLLMELKGKVYFLEEPLIRYVRHGQNASPTGETGYPIYKKLTNRIFMLLNVFLRVIR